MRTKMSLEDAAARGDIKALCKALKAGKDVDDSWGSKMALQCAAEQGHHPCVRLLLTLGADVTAACEHDEVDVGGWTALMFTAANGHHSCILPLVRGGADLEKADVFGQTPLMAAAEDGYARVVRTLLQAGAVAELRDGVEWPRHGTRPGQAECVRLITTYGRLKKWRLAARVLPFAMAWVRAYAKARFGPGSAYAAYQANRHSGGDALARKCLALQHENEELRRCLKRKRQGTDEARRCREVVEHVLGMDGEEERALVWG